MDSDWSDEDEELEELERMLDDIQASGAHTLLRHREKALQHQGE